MSRREPRARAPGHVRLALALALGAMCSGCLAIQTVKHGELVQFNLRLSHRLAKERRHLDPSSPEELFARESFHEGNYVFVILNRRAVSSLEVTPEGLLLKGPDGKRAGGVAVRILEDFHEDTRAAMDPGNDELALRYAWYLQRDLVTPVWGEEPPLKLERDGFYGRLKRALAREDGQPVTRVRMSLVPPRNKQYSGAPELVACVAVHDDWLYEPSRYFAHLAGVDATHVRLQVRDEWSVRELDAKLQEYLCRAEFQPLDRRPSVFVGSRTLYQSVVTAYLGKRADSGGKLQGLEFISRYLAATIINAFQRGVEAPSTPVGLFVEIKEGQMHPNEGGRRFVQHRLVEEARGRELATALVEAVELVDRATRSRPQGEDALAHRLQAAQQLSQDARRREPVRQVLKMFLESASLLMPRYTEDVLRPAPAVKPNGPAATAP